MEGFKESFEKLSKHNSPNKMKLGDDYQYPIKGSSEASYKLHSGKYMKMKDVLFVPRIKNNLLSKWKYHRCPSPYVAKWKYHR